MVLKIILTDLISIAEENVEGGGEVRRKGRKLGLDVLILT